MCQSNKNYIDDILIPLMMMELLHFAAKAVNYSNKTMLLMILCKILIEYYTSCQLLKQQQNVKCC